MSEPHIPDKYTSFADILHLPATAEYVDDGSNIAVYLHSAGTTGDPKTVVLSNYAFNAQVENVMCGVDSLTDADKEMGMLMVLPLFHGFGLGIGIHLAMSRIRCLPMPRFSAKRAVDMMKKDRVSVLAGVPDFVAADMVDGDAYTVLPAAFGQLSHLSNSADLLAAKSA